MLLPYWLKVSVPLFLAAGVPRYVDRAYAEDARPLIGAGRRKDAAEAGRQYTNRKMPW